MNPWKTTRLVLLSGGLTLAALAWIWLLVRPFQQQAWWGVISLVLPPGGPSLFALRHAQRAIAPLVAFTLGSILAAALFGYSLLGPVDLGLREQVHARVGYSGR